MEQLLSGEGSRAPTFAKIHGNNGDVIKAADLDLMRCPGGPCLSHTQLAALHFPRCAAAFVVHRAGVERAGHTWYLK